MSVPKIAVLDIHTLNATQDLELEPLSRLGLLNIYDTTPPELIVKRLKGHQIAVINKIKLDKGILMQLPELQYVCIAATGYNNVDIDFANSRGIMVSNVAGYSTMSVAEHVFALIFAITKKVQFYSDEVMLKNRWQNQPYFSFWDASIPVLTGKTMGILGYGDIGRAVARIAQSFDMKVIVNRHSNGPIDTNYKQVTKEVLWQESDLISLHAPLTNDTQHIINASSLHKMKPNAILINTSRGGLIDEGALHKALTTGQIRAAALDVLDEEPPRVRHQLFDLKNCIITPHQAWASLQSRSNLLKEIILNIEGFLQNKPRNIVTVSK